MFEETKVESNNDPNNIFAESLQNYLNVAVGISHSIRFEIRTHDHPPPHFHAEDVQSELDVRVELESCTIYREPKGKNKKKKTLKKIEEWCIKNQDELKEVWKRTRPTI